MTLVVAWIIAGFALVVAALAGWYTLKNEPFSNALFYVIASLELALVAGLIGGSLALAQTSRPVDGVIFVSYLVTVVIIPPVAVIWGVAEKSRWGTGVVVVAMITVAALVARVHQIWVTPIG